MNTAIGPTRLMRVASGAGGIFTVHGPSIGRDSALVDAGFSFLWNNRVSTYVFYDGNLGRSNYNNNAVSGGSPGDVLRAIEGRAIPDSFGLINLGRRTSFCLAGIACLLALPDSSHAQRREISQDLDLKELDLSRWDCLNKPGTRQNSRRYRAKQIKKPLSAPTDSVQHPEAQFHRLPEVCVELG